MPPRRRGNGWMVFALILLFLLFLSGLLILSLLSSGMTPKGTRVRTAGPRLEEAVLEDNDAEIKIAVLDVDGIISSRALDQSGFTMVDLLKSQLERAKEDTKVKAVILRVDSPGGEVLASDEIYRAIADFQKKSGKPVIAAMGSLAASGGYYVSSPCRWIVANELTITGSIGVIMHGWNYRALMDKVGLRPEVYKSGKFKDMLSGERTTEEIPKEERAMVQSLIDETYARFKEVVGEGRNSAHEKNKDAGKALSADWKDYADGRVLSGTQAYELGFVDQLGNFRDAVERAAAIANISATNVNLVKYQQRLDLSDFLRIFGKTEAPALKIDLGMEAPKIEAGRLYFLSPTFLH
jgi:protease-4